MENHIKDQRIVDVPVRDRLIVALDVPSEETALQLVDELGDTVTFYKVGLELFVRPGYFQLITTLRSRGKHVFADLKLNDIPATVSAAVRGIRDCGAKFLTVHGDPKTVEAAVKEKGSHLSILAVTVLTSFDDQDLKAMGYAYNVRDLVEMRARNAEKAGCDGVIASAQEAATLRGILSKQSVIVTPGIRPAVGAQTNTIKRDDQKRVLTPKEAIAQGADYIVVGRPIRDASDKQAVAQQIIDEIALGLTLR